MVSDFAYRLLRLHSQRAKDLFYGVEMLGSLFGEKDLRRLDEAYTELQQAALMEKTGAEARFFGDYKWLFKVTPKGLEMASQETAA